MKTKIGTFPLRMPLSLKAAIEKLAARDGTSVNQFLVIAAAEKLSAMQAEEFFAERRGRADREAFLRVLNRAGGKPPVETDRLDD